MDAPVGDASRMRLREMRGKKNTKCFFIFYLPLICFKRTTKLKKYDNIILSLFEYQFTMINLKSQESS